MNALTSEEILIAGAGIAGLTLALCLHARNTPCIIFERRANVSTEGAGIQLTPNALRVFDQLALLPDILKKSSLPEAIDVRSGTSGKRLVRMALGQSFKEKYHYPYVVIHRADLVVILNKAAEQRGIPVLVDHTVEDVLNHSDHVEINTTKGNHQGSMLIAADGVWSTLRPLVNAKEAFFSGRTAYRAVIEMPDDPKDLHVNTGLWLGDKAHLVHYPIRNGRKLNLVCILSEKNTSQSWSTPSDNAPLREALATWHAEPRVLVDAINEWQKWPLYGVDGRANWHQGRVALIGDSAHAMVPFLAQGGAMAIEDTAVLADAITRHAIPAEAFADYEIARKSRVTRVQREALTNGERYHWGGVKAISRDAGLKLLGGKRLLQKYNWIYEWSPPEPRDLE